MMFRALLQSLTFASAFALGVAATSPAAAQAPAKKPLTFLVVGASGMVGSRITAEAASRGHQVIAAARNTDKITATDKVHPEKLDATDTPAFTALARKADVIVLATSPRGGGDPIAEEKAVADSAMATAKATGKRIVVVGGGSSLNKPDGTPLMDSMPPAAKKGEPMALRNVLDALKASDLDWTFVSPPMSIRPGVKTGKYRVGTTVMLYDADGKAAISAEDFSDALVSEVENPQHHRSQMTVAY